MESARSRKATHSDADFGRGSIIVSSRDAVVDIGLAKVIYPLPEISDEACRWEHKLCRKYITNAERHSQ